jgi:uncharacterized glyoxalase superfamily protein PhnB
MKICQSLLIMFAVSVAACLAQTPKDFDACRIFTAEDAEKALAVAVKKDVVNNKARSKDKAVMACSYSSEPGDAKPPQAAAVLFRFARSDEEAKRMFSESRLEVRGRPMIIARADTFWDEKSGQLNVLKGNVWLTVNAGPPGQQKREPEAAKKLAAALIPKI